MGIFGTITSKLKGKTMFGMLTVPGLSIPKGVSQSEIQSSLDSGLDVYLPRRSQSYSASELHLSVPGQRLFSSGQNTVIEHVGDGRLFSVHENDVVISDMSIHGNGGLQTKGITTDDCVNGCRFSGLVVKNFDICYEDDGFENSVLHSVLTGYSSYGAVHLGGADWKLDSVMFSTNHKNIGTAHILANITGWKGSNLVFGYGRRGVDLSPNGAASVTLDACHWENMDETDFEIYATTRQSVTVNGGRADGRFRAGGSAEYGARYFLNGVRFIAPAMVDNAMATWVMLNNHNLSENDFSGGPGKRTWLDQIGS